LFSSDEDKTKVNKFYERSGSVENVCLKMSIINAIFEKTVHGYDRYKERSSLTFLHPEKNIRILYDTERNSLEMLANPDIAEPEMQKIMRS